MFRAPLGALAARRGRKRTSITALRPSKRSRKSTARKKLNDVRVYTRLEYRTKQMLNSLMDDATDENVNRVHAFHQLGLRDGKQVCLTKTRANTCVNGLFYPKVYRRKIATAKKWTPVNAAKVQKICKLDVAGYETEYEASCAALLYRFWSDIEFRLTLICATNENADRKAIVKLREERGNFCAELQSEYVSDAIRERYGYYSQLQNILETGKKIINKHFYSRTADKLIELPANSVVSEEEYANVVVKLEIIRKYCDIQLLNVKNQLVACAQNRLEDQPSTNSVVAQVVESFKDAGKAKRGRSSIINYTKEFFELDESTGQIRYKLTRDGRGRHQKSSILFDPAVRAQLKQWTRENLKTLSCESAMDYINLHILQRKDELGNYVISEEDLIKGQIKNRVARTICRDTAHNWITHPSIGCHRVWNKKDYYVDNHESERAHLQRAAYIPEWKEDLIREQVWISFTAEENQVMREKLRNYMLTRKVTKAHVNQSPEAVNKFMENFKPDHESSDGSLVEYNIDRSSYLQELGNLRFKGGADWSKFAPDRDPNDPNTWRLRRIGQDEATFKSQTFKRGVWAQDNLVPLFPKSDGMGRMVSAFFSRQSGFHLDISDEQLIQVNANRSGKLYSMQAVAQEERKQRIVTSNMNKKPRNQQPIPTGPVFKQPITRANLPWILYLDIGINRDGYFTFAKFYKQLEDLFDVLEVMHPEEQICIELDWSGCHNTKSPDALDAGNINLGITPKNKDKGGFHDSELSKGCLGKSPKYDHFTKKVVNGEDVFVQHFRFRQGEKPLYPYNGPEDLTGVPKGIKQVLMERDLWVPGMRLNAPVIDGVKRNELSAKHVLSVCPDFANVKTLLQEFIEKRGRHFKVMKTPICHPELAGLGIEYAWGHAKRTYRRMPERLQSFKVANTKQELHVRQCLGSVSEACSRRYAGKTFEYKMVYAKEPGAHMSHNEIELGMKVMKSHRDCGQMHGAFIKSTMTALEHQVKATPCQCYLCKETPPPKGIRLV